MKDLLIKEFRLAIHPTVLIFWLLSAMLLIPNYPYYVVFFYTTLGLFFVCLTGRENHDIEYSLCLPIRKRDIVKGRIAFAVTVQLMQMLVAVPFALLRAGMPMPGNQVGMDANVALFGLSFLMLGIFNLTFFPRYYRKPEKVGKAFMVGSTYTFLYIGLCEALTHVLPLFQMLDTPDPAHMGAKLGTLACGAALYALFTILAYKISLRRFELLDL